MNIATKKLVIFDLDGTLAPSKSPIEDEMGQLLIKLLGFVKVAIISGGGYPQFQTQLLGRLPHGLAYYTNLLLLPASGTSLYTWKGDWHQNYSEEIPIEDRKRIISTLARAMQGFVNEEKSYGPIIEDRLSQITFSGMGQSAPLSKKIVWDSDHKKRQKIVEIIAPKLPEYDCRIGGTSSIDITHKGVNKAYGIRKLEQYLDLDASQILFVGDALFHGGNDFPARATGVDCISVKNPTETQQLITEWVTNLLPHEPTTGTSAVEPSKAAVLA
ncbi:MAG: HAD-IIB family hydrolase [Patescibacteria group bacterium]